jgi:hypothetical protein
MIFNTFKKASTTAGIAYATVPSGARLDILSGATFNNAATTIFTGTTSIGTSNTSGIVLTSSATNGLQVVAEDGGVAVTSGNIKAIKGRLFLKANCGDMTADGILGQVKINTDITCSADYTNGIRGYLELVGGNTVNTGGANANIGAGGHAVHGWITAAGNLTIASGHYLCGVASRLSVSATKSITATGTLAAYGVFADDNLGGATPTQTWGYGLYMPDGVVTNGIYFGNCTTGINFGGAVAQGLTSYAFAYGTISSAKSLTPTASVVPLQINIASVANSGTNGDETIGAAYFKTAAITATNADHQLATVMVRTSLTQNIFDAYGLQSHLAISGSMATHDDNAHLTAISGKVTFSSAPTVSKGWITAGLFIVEGAGTVTQMCSGVSIVVEAGSTGCESLLYLNSDAAVVTGIDFVGNANLTNAFAWGTTTGCIGTTELVDNASSDVNCDGHIVCDVGGTPYYIPLYNTKK